MTKWVLLVVALGLAACQAAQESAPLSVQEGGGDARPRVYAVHYPLAWMAERIGGDAVEVVLPVPDGVDPGHWQPSPEIVLEYQGADLVLLNGAGYAAWTQFASLSPSRLVNTTRGLEDRFVHAGEVRHRHGPVGAHDHGDVASHTWLDPTLAAEQAGAVAEAIARLAPSASSDFERRRGELVVGLETWDRAVGAVFALRPAAQFFYSHPIYQYLDARYHLEGAALNWEPDREPDEEAWRTLKAAVDPTRPTLMLWEAAPLDSVAARLEALGVRPVVFETGANPRRKEGYQSLLERNRVRLLKARQELGSQESQVQSSTRRLD